MKILVFQLISSYKYQGLQKLIPLKESTYRKIRFKLWNDKLYFSNIPQRIAIDFLFEGEVIWIHNSTFDTHVSVIFFITLIALSEITQKLKGQNGLK